MSDEKRELYTLSDAECADTVKARLDRALALLKEVEWAGDCSTCPSCGEYDTYLSEAHDIPSGGHAPGCKLKALLGEK